MKKFRLSDNVRKKVLESLLFLLFWAMLITFCVAISIVIKYRGILPILLY